MGCFKTGKGKWKRFSLQWYRADNKWNLWYSKKTSFNIKKGCSISKMRRKIHLPWRLWQKSLLRCIKYARIWVFIDPYFLMFYALLSYLILSFFLRPSSQLPTLDMILAECKQLPNFAVMSKSTLSKWSRKLGFCYKRCSKKMRAQQQFVALAQRNNYLIKMKE